MGLSGSGKGTQALKLEQRRGFVHIESSKVIEDRFASQAGDPVIERERARKAAGDIVATELVSVWMLDAIAEWASTGASLVFSGSPRTVYEAQSQLPMLRQFYRIWNVHAFHLQVDPEIAKVRSLVRRVCEAHQHPVPPEYAGTACPVDGSWLKVRDDDSDPAKVAFRHSKFEEQTAPVLQYLAENGCPPVDVPAGRSPEEVHVFITDVLDRHRS